MSPVAWLLPDLPNPEDTMTPLALALRHSHVERPSGPPILLIHGFLASGARDWPEATWQQPLTAAGRGVIVPDLPGHGDSAPATAGVARLVDALAALAGEGPVDVVAYSLGARLAWSLAARHAASVRRMVLGGLAPFDPFAAVDVRAARAMLAGGPAPADPLTGMIGGMIAAHAPDPAAMLDLVAALGAEPFDPSAEAPSCPVLLLAGQDDPMMQGVEALAAALPGARLERVPGDHQGALHAPEFRAEAFAFLGLTPQ